MMNFLNIDTTFDFLNCFSTKNGESAQRGLLFVQILSFALIFEVTKSLFPH